MAPKTITKTKHPDQIAIERELGLNGAPTAVPWVERPILNISTAASLLGCSAAQVYALANAGQLELVWLAGKACVRTAGVEKLIREAQPWTPSGRNRAAIVERHRRANARLAAASAA